jgi:site-specific recombinase XerD
MKTYDEVVKSIHKRNENLIYNFGGWLKRSGLGEKTIDKHVDNLSFFLNEYLVYQDISDNENEITLCNAEDGIDFIDDFLGYWFIRKAMWSDERSIKSNIASFKKFYTFMESLNLISKEELRDLNEEIKGRKKKWIDEVNRFNDPDDDFWDFE